VKEKEADSGGRKLKSQTLEAHEEDSSKGYTMDDDPRRRYLIRMRINEVGPVVVGDIGANTAKYISVRCQH